MIFHIAMSGKWGAGDPKGIYVHELLKDSVLWEEYVKQMAGRLYFEGKDPEATKGKDAIRYGHLQHKDLRPMWGRIPLDTSKARNKWSKDVCNTVRYLRKLFGVPVASASKKTCATASKKTYVSPFDGRVK